MRWHVFVPESQRSPVKVQKEGGVMLPEARHEGRGQCSGQLQVLVSKQQRSDRGIHTGQDTEQTNMDYMMIMIKTIITSPKYTAYT